MTPGDDGRSAPIQTYLYDSITQVAVILSRLIAFILARHVSWSAQSHEPLSTWAGGHCDKSGKSSRIRQPGFVVKLTLKLWMVGVADGGWRRGLLRKHSPGKNWAVPRFKSFAFALVRNQPASLHMK